MHRDAHETFDESADLAALARSPVLVVASGVKSILDIGATLERLDTLGVPVLGFGTRRFPGFYRRDSGFELDWSVASRATRPRAPSCAPRVFADRVPRRAIPSRPSTSSTEQLHDDALESALNARSTCEGVRGKDVTPALLTEFARRHCGCERAGEPRPRGR